jgi:hypothetical protein
MMAAKLPSPAAETPVIVDPASRRGKMQAVWRLCCWGIGTAVAITLVVLASQTETGSQQLQFAFARAHEPEQPQAVAVVPPRVVLDEATSRRLADAVRALTADRDRLNSRLASLERSFNDMTGSIKTVMQANVAAQNAKAPKQTEPEKTLAPIISAPAASAPEIAPPPAPQTASVRPPPVAEPPPAEIQTQEFVPLPPVRVASTAPSDPASEPQVPAKIEYGIDLGSAASMDAARGEWLKAKANYGPLLTGLHPVASLRQRASGGSDYRLVVGPFASAIAASRMCAKFNAARIACRTAKFTGEDLAPR